MKFCTIEEYAVLQKERKRIIHLYLYYPDTYGNLLFKSILENKYDNLNGESCKENVDLGLDFTVYDNDV